MKSIVALGLGLGVLLMSTQAHAVEILRWERLPLAVPLVVGQERIVFVDRNVRVGVPAEIADSLRVQSAAGAVYLRASAPIAPTRLQVQDVDSGSLILVDISAEPARKDAPPLEPVRIIEAATPPARYGQTAQTATPQAETPKRETPVPVVLIRHAAQQLYAPLRTVEPVPGIARVPLRRDLALDTLLPMEPVQAHPLAAWRLEDQWVSAVRLTHTGTGWLVLDPRALQGDLVAATFQHERLGPRGTPEDTTVLYLVTRGHGLAQALLPALHRFDPSLGMQEADHAQ